MERLPSLINKLKQRNDEGGTPTELLLLLDEIRAELNSTVAVADHTRASVSVWVPAGYTRVEENSPTENKDEKVDETEKLVEISAPQIEKPLISAFPFITENEQTPGKPMVKDEPLPVFNGVPKPPVSILEEEEPVLETDNGPAENEYQEEPLTISFIHEVLAKAAKEEPRNTETAPLDEPEAPVIFELDLPDQEVSKPVSPYSGQRTLFEETEKFLSGSLVETGVVSKPQELHEILASRVVAKPESAPPGKRVLADTLGGGKINDLRKAIAINDRFRFIKSLFRGDETLFERSLKTINNFNILPEAQYWIQRELVIKLGWNDEDELVQQFYSLVSRRFL